MGGHFIVILELVNSIINSFFIKILKSLDKSKLQKKILIRNSDLLMKHDDVQPLSNSSNSIKSKHSPEII